MLLRFRRTYRGEAREAEVFTLFYRVSFLFFFVNVFVSMATLVREEPKIRQGCRRHSEVGGEVGGSAAERLSGVYTQSKMSGE